MPGRSRSSPALLGVLLFAAACRLTPVTRATVPIPRDGTEVGIASWYGPGFHGRRTSSGETFDQFRRSAAHQTHPFGTRLRVTNLENGRSTEVEVTDRGPFAKGRILDLSYRAGRDVGMIRDGTALVLVEPIRVPGERIRRVFYAVQAAAFRDPDRAELLRGRLARRFPSVYLLRHERRISPVYRVRIGPYAARDEAVRIATSLARSGLSPYVVEEAR